MPKTKKKCILLIKNPNIMMIITPHSALLGFSTQTKSSEDETAFGTYYDVKEVGISQEKHLSLGFPLS